jgi:hypothetical protein
MVNDSPEHLEDKPKEEENMHQHSSDQSNIDEEGQISEEEEGEELESSPKEAGDHPSQSVRAPPKPASKDRTSMEAEPRQK